MSSIQINMWLQDAIEAHLMTHVREQVREELEEESHSEVYVSVERPVFGYGTIDVKWRTSSLNWRDGKDGEKSFTLAEVLRICMMEGKEA